MIQLHCDTDKDLETGQIFCLTHQKFVCVVCKMPFEPETDTDAKCKNCEKTVL